jgi:uncharacterized protein (DUF1015 family)
MPEIRPFKALRYARGMDHGAVIAPPYDVIDQGRFEALGKDAHNIVHVDVPHMPPKSVGPVESYARAAARMNEWIDSGVLVRDRRAAIYPYCQSYELHGRTIHRRGFFALVKLSAFGEGQVIPHEKTYRGAIEDRLMLMRATQTALSPVFGLYSDAKNDIEHKLFKHVGRPEVTAVLDGVTNQVWSVTDAAVEMEIIDLFKGRPIYIADGHHRYTTALQYQAELTQAAEEEGGGALPVAHPANYALFSLVSMQDEGLVIFPTHRLVGGLAGFDVMVLREAVKEHFDVVEVSGKADQAFLNHLPAHGIGLMDGKTRKVYQIVSKGTDVLAKYEAGASPAWRKLDVAVLQRYLIDEVIKVKFAGGEGPVMGYTAFVDEVGAKLDGGDKNGIGYQIALLVRPTPLTALEELGRTGELMPQKSTFFYPKVATGLVMHELRG